jgi:ribosomal protein S17E
VHPNCLTFHRQTVYDKPKHYNKKISSANLRDNTHSSKMSKQAQRKCKRAINYLLLNSTSKCNYSRINYKDTKFKISFITLTLPARQMHTDNQIKRDCLNSFLIEANRLWDVKHYVWRQEKQRNGNLHFHLLFDKFVPWQEVRGLWNRLISKLGYIESYRHNMLMFHSKGFKVRKDLINTWSVANQIKAYTKGKKNNWCNPNTTDIHSVRFVNNISAYVTKYMTKESSKRYRKIKASVIGYKRQYVRGSKSLSCNVLKYLNTQAQIGRLWACSISLSNLKGGLTEIDSKVSCELDRLSKDSRCKYFNDNYVQVLICPIQVAIENKCILLVQLLSEFMCERFILNTA